MLLKNEYKSIERAQITLFLGSSACVCLLKAAASFRPCIESSDGLNAQKGCESPPSKIQGKSRKVQNYAISRPILCQI
jgi:hypothetical protein